LVAESVEKPGNLGAILRTADAVGATAVITVGSAVDPFNPNVIRSSTGTIFSVPYAHTELSDLARWLNANDIELVVAAPDAEAVLWETDLAGSVAIMVGSENLGLSKEAIAAAQHSVAIPMAGTSDSLNVSVSIAVFAFEVRRQQSQL
jgi:TrmH family RNA methyltransferase